MIDQKSRIILRGSDKVVILIGGKQSSLTGFGSQKGLDNIPASQIEMAGQFFSAKNIGKGKELS